MPRTSVKSFADPDEVRLYEKGRTELVRLGDLSIGRDIAEPGWRWSLHVKPIAGTRRCEILHQGFVMSGRMRIETEDGSTYDVHEGDLYEIVPGHDAWVVGDEPVMLLDFAGTAGSFAKPAYYAGDRMLATVMFTDVVGSTALAERLGDSRWQELLSLHNRIVRRELDSFRGREVKTTGDGFLATFDSAARAVRCAAAIRNGVAPLELAIRVGLHTGEVEYVGADVRGVAVHAAARVTALAGAGEIFVSGTTYDLLAGSGLGFESRGSHELKGLSGPRPVYALTDVAAAPESLG